jgi:hypothetical protein
VTDSIDRKSETKAELALRLKSLRSPKMKERVEHSDVPRWVKIAYAKKEILGLSYQEAADEFGKKAATLKNYNISPWVKAWRTELNDIADDPLQVAAMILKGSVLEAALDQLWAIEAAKHRGDYKEVRLGTRDILQSHDLMVTQQRGGGAQQGVVINITMPKGMSTEPITVEADYEVIEQEGENED